MKSKKHGGLRQGSGRKAKEKTKVMRVPESLVDQIKALIEAYRQADV